MSELRAGGLALIIKSSVTEEVGKVVTCLQLITAGAKYTPPQTKGATFCWPEGEPNAWMVSGDVKTYCQWTKKSGGFYVEGWGVYTADQLIPLDGEDFSNERERERELNHG